MDRRYPQSESEMVTATNGLACSKASGMSKVDSGDSAGVHTIRASTANIIVVNLATKFQIAVEAPDDREIL